MWKVNAWLLKLKDDSIEIDFSEFVGQYSSLFAGSDPGMYDLMFYLRVITIDNIILYLSIRYSGRRIFFQQKVKHEDK